MSLSYGISQVTSFNTPLKVTHAANCGNVPPTLTVQMDTTIGSLSVGALSATTASVGGVSCQGVDGLLHVVQGLQLRGIRR